MSEKTSCIFRAKGYNMSEERAAELSPFAKINDNYPKTLITADSFGLGDENGVQIVNIFDFLLS